MFRIEWTRDAEVHLNRYAAFEQRLIANEISLQLTHEPCVASFRRKILRDNPIAKWELKIGKFRVFYNIDEAENRVTVLSIGHKSHNILFVGGKEITL